MSRYDSATTVFSPDGHLFQVEYALEAVHRGTTAVGVRGNDVCILAVEKRTSAKLQDTRTLHKVSVLDDHVAIAFAGLNADGRVLVERARIECQRHRISVEDPVTVEYIARYLATIKQTYTQSSGKRPFGVSSILVGFDPHSKKPFLFETDPQGTYSAWKANAVGRNSKTVVEYLEKAYTDETAASERACMKLAIQALLEVVQSGAKSIELAVLRRDQPLTFLSAADIEALVEEIKVEREAEAAKKPAGDAGKSA